MCGIVGYIGKGPVVATALDALSRLEYRGYDSTGIAVLNHQGVKVRKRIGKLRVLLADLAASPLEGTMAICHSRWATHGEPSDVNAHPQTDCTGRLALVHNGIIENYVEIKERLRAKGHAFRSQTDTEVLAHLVEELANTQPLAEAFRAALRQVRGTYAIGLISADEPARIFAARNGSPLIIGVGRGETMIASDVPAMLARTRRVIYLHDGETVELRADGITLSTAEGKPIQRKATTVTWSAATAQKDGFPHFMLKEIHEQQSAIEQTMYNRLDLDAGRVTFDRRTTALLNRIGSSEKLVLIACGTAYHAGLVGEYMLEECAKIPVDVDVASEFRYRGAMLDRNTTVIAITQSGETADTLAGVKLAKAQGAKVLAICNVMGSSIARAADAVLYTHAGPEISVASTKAYTSQLTALLLLTLYLAEQRKHLGVEERTRLVCALAGLPRVVAQALKVEPAVKKVATRYAKARNFYYLGRRYNYPSALEGALKLKEVCPLIHAEGYAAGEMKHGPISLIRKGWPVVILAPDSPVYEKVVSNLEEVRARKGECIAIATEGNQTIKKHATQVLYVPKTEELFSPIVAAIPLQLLAYHIARLNKCDIDQPPNLAKSVTVE